MGYAPARNKVVYRVNGSTNEAFITYRNREGRVKQNGGSVALDVRRRSYKRANAIHFRPELQNL